MVFDSNLRVNCRLNSASSRLLWHSYISLIKSGNTWKRKFGCIALQPRGEAYGRYLEEQEIERG